jgi:hypothetical protein
MARRLTSDKAAPCGFCRDGFHETSAGQLLGRITSFVSRTPFPGIGFDSRRLQHFPMGIIS